MSEAQEVPKRQKGSYVGAPACFRLELACQSINRAFSGFGCYLVGSALLRPDWRDIDVRFIMSDDAFRVEFPGTYPADCNGGHWEFDPKWILLTTTISRWLSDQSGLPVDFQFQPQTHANERHGKGKGTHRHALGMIFAKESDE